MGYNSYQHHRAPDSFCTYRLADTWKQSIDLCRCRLVPHLQGTVRTIIEQVHNLIADFQTLLLASKGTKSNVQLAIVPDLLDVAWQDFSADNVHVVSGLPKVRNFRLVDQSMYNSERIYCNNDVSKQDFVFFKCRPQALIIG